MRVITYPNVIQANSYDAIGKLITAYGWIPDTEWGTNPLWQANLTANQTLQTAAYNYLIADHLGTPQLAINNQGKQTWKIHSDGFGNTTLDPNNQITLNLVSQVNITTKKQDYPITTLGIITQRQGVTFRVTRLD